MDCRNCPNTQCLIGKHANKTRMEPFLSKKNTMTCKKGQSFIIEGAPVHGLYFIKDGKVKVSKTGLHGKEQIVRFGTNGDIVGHRGFGGGNAYQVNAVALQTTILCNFSSDTLSQMLHAVPELTYDMMIFYSEELNRSETKVKKFAQMTVREKVVDALLYMHRKFGKGKSGLNIQLSRKEIADFAGTNEEQVIRNLSALKKEGIITTSGKKIDIPNVDLLRKEIAEHNFFIDS